MGASNFAASACSLGANVEAMRRIRIVPFSPDSTRALIASTLATTERRLRFSNASAAARSLKLDLPSCLISPSCVGTLLLAARFVGPAKKASRRALRGSLPAGATA